MIIAAIIFNAAEVLLIIITPYVFPDHIKEWVTTGDEVTMGLVILVVYAVVLVHIMHPLRIFQQSGNDFSV